MLGMLLTYTKVEQYLLWKDPQINMLPIPHPYKMKLTSMGSWQLTSHKALFIIGMKVRYYPQYCLFFL